MDYHDLIKLDDAQLLQRLTKLDAKVYDGDPQPGLDELEVELDLAGQEVNRRFGTDACDLLASYWTASHAAADDRVRDAEEMPEVLVEIAKGEHVHRPSERRNGNCICGVQAEQIESANQRGL